MDLDIVTLVEEGDVLRILVGVRLFTWLFEFDEERDAAVNEEQNIRPPARSAQV